MSQTGLTDLFQGGHDDAQIEIQNNAHENEVESNSKKKSKARKVLSLLDSPRKIILQRTNQYKRNNYDKNNKITKKSNLKDKNRNYNTTENDNNCLESNNPEQPLDRNAFFCEINDDSKNTMKTGNQEAHSLGIDVQVPKLNVLNWILNEAPLDLVSKILSFTGPRMIKCLCCVNSQWKELCLSEPLWRILCEDYGKYDPDKENIMNSDGISGSGSINPYHLKQDPHFWRHYYADNPIVPVDYDSVESAVNSISCQIYNKTIMVRNGRSRYETMEPIPVQVRNVSILLSPGVYVLEKPIVIHAIANSIVTIQTWETKTNKTKYVQMIQNNNELSKTRPSPSSSSSNSFAKSRLIGDFLSPTKRRIRHLLNCHHTNSDSVLEPQVMNQINGTDNSTGDLHVSNYALSQLSKRKLRTLETSSKAILLYQSSYANQPIVRLRQGKLLLRNLLLVHDCPGTDIWNGNTAVQIQPMVDRNDIPVNATFSSMPPTAIIDSVDITSTSGRGVVVIDGGITHIKKCYIHDCAATGVYVGGSGSQATIIYSDIIKNGHGNKTSSREGIGRGHSGVYLEQGVSTLTECNISHNSLTGISAVSPDNATLTVEDSDLVSNGSLQLELPEIGTASRRRSVTRNNNLSGVGTARTRSDFIIDEEIDSSQDREP